MSTGAWLGAALLAAVIAGAALVAMREPTRPAVAPAPPSSKETFRMARERLVQVLRGEGIRDERVLAAIGRVPRERFVPPSLHPEAYGNYPLPIGHEQTISQPYVVAFMTEAALGPPPPGTAATEPPPLRVLEIGTGSGYQAAVLAEVLGLGPGGTGRGRLASIEIVEPLGQQARRVLEELGYRVDLRIGDGYRGWPELAPFDAILVTAAPGHVPRPLVDQLAERGRLVIPVGEGTQDLQVITKTSEGLREESVLPVRFVPMTGEAQRPKR